MAITWIDFNVDKPPLGELLIIKRCYQYRNYFFGRFRRPAIENPEKYNSDYYELLETNAYEQRYKPLEKDVKYYYSTLD